MAKKSNNTKCIKCNKHSDIICAKCGAIICSKHCYHTNKRIYCSECFLKERNIGLLKGWLMLFVLIAFAIFAIYSFDIVG
jgi:hypothetical protein